MSICRARGPGFMSADPSGSRGSMGAESSMGARGSGGEMKKLLIAAALMLSVVAPAFAHHSPAAFEAQKTVTLTGVIKEFRWQNPHTWIELYVPNEKGEEVLWTVELTSPTYLVRAGW